LRLGVSPSSTPSSIRSTFGVIKGVLLVMVAHVIWDSDFGAETVRIVSARQATKQERRTYENDNG
jgi:uncharacterized protein